MKVEIIIEDKEKYMDLLLLADEQENMIKKYLNVGEMFALFDEELTSICIVIEESNGIFEIKNIDTYKKHQGKGYGKYLINYIFDFYRNRGKIMYVGTGESPLTLPFYEKLGFKYSHRIKDFFIDNYNHPIYECGIQLKDMVYLKREF